MSDELIQYGGEKVNLGAMFRAKPSKIFKKTLVLPLRDRKMMP
ncbi:MAG: hypothetical protein NZ740_08725 [Kiritimatiellae bacterium]|nr:hypothetical protein [Kiritimatiellia bacterium]MDW8459176.1 hypothetical protein [Verrucomicrobiota bacterium]